MCDSGYLYLLRSAKRGLFPVELYGLFVILCECLFLQRLAKRATSAVELYGLSVILSETDCVCSGQPTGASLLLNSTGSV